MINSKRAAYHVGAATLFKKKAQSPFLEKEIFVIEIKYFHVRFKGAPIKKAVILSESALQNDQYKALENRSKIETLL